jgi:serine protease Do
VIPLRLVLSWPLLAVLVAAQPWPVLEGPGDLPDFFRSLVRDQHRSVVELRSTPEEGEPTRLLGVIIDKEGFILTKASELKGKTEVRQGFAWREVELKAQAESHDLALLLARSLKGREGVRWTPTEPKPGDWLISLGSKRTPVAVGIVSSPLSATASPGWLGVQVGDDPRGAKIGKVESDSPAEKGDLVTGDIITHIAAIPVKGKSDLLRHLRPLLVDAVVTLTIFRDYESLERIVTLAPPPLSMGGAGLDRPALHGPVSSRRHGLPSTIRHDTVLRPSECGGPVMDTNGHVIGINIARVSRTHSALLLAAEIQAVLPGMLEQARR